MLCQLVCACVCLALLVLNWAQLNAQELPPPEMARPGGDYRIAWLTLEKAWEGGADLPLFLGLRDGRATAVWYCAAQRTDAHRMWIEENSLRLTDATLKGEVGGRMVKQWAPIAETGLYRIRVDAERKGEQLVGRYTATFRDKTTTGVLTGALVSEDRLRKENAVPADKEWPAYYGVNFAFRGPDSGIALIDDLTKIKPLWKGEESLPCMWGKGPDDRYKHRACVTGCAGGASSPVVARGMVICYYYRPAGMVGEKLSWNRSPPHFKNEREIREFARRHSSSPAGQQLLVDWHRPFADDIVVGIDAATGKLVWKTVFKLRSGNYQTHKWRGYNPTPTVADGVAYVQGYGNRLYALEATSGKVLWEYDGVSTRRVGKEAPPGATGPLVVGDAVVICAGSRCVALDRKSGKELWKKPGGNMLLWRKDGRDRIITYGGHGKVSVACQDPVTGREFWKADTRFSTTAGTTVHPILAGDSLIGFEVKVTANVSDEARVICYRLQDDGLKEAWVSPAPVPMTDTYGLTVGNGHVYIDGEREVFCLNLLDGKRIATLAGVGGARTQVALFAEGRVFIQPEGRHGSQSFFMVDGDPKHVRRLSSETTAAGNHRLAGQWIPPHPHDTAYANQPVVNPVVDGRMFIRGHDGLYCYDLRRGK